MRARVSNACKNTKISLYGKPPILNTLKSAVFYPIFVAFRPILEGDVGGFICFFEEKGNVLSS